MALDAAKQNDQEGGGHLREIISKVESELVGGLKNKGIDAEVLKKVEQRLHQRMDQCMQKLESDLLLRKSSSAAGETKTAATALQILEEGVEDGEELKGVLQQVRTNLKEKGIDENNYQKIYEEITKAKTGLKKKPEPKPTATAHIEKEIFRSLRYDTPFSMITFSILRATPRQPVRKGSITREHINKAVMEKLVSLVRVTDIIGYLDKTKIISVMPMTEEKFGRKAMARVMKILHSDDYYVGEIPIEIKLVAQVTGFDKDRTDTLKAFIRRAETDILNMANRLKNIQSLY
jgi:hypothetical protein